VAAPAKILGNARFQPVCRILRQTFKKDAFGKMPNAARKMRALPSELEVAAAP
jgi:hypothetical protein